MTSEEWQRRGYDHAPEIEPVALLGWFTLGFAAVLIARLIREHW